MTADDSPRTAGVNMYASSSELTWSNRTLMAIQDPNLTHFSLFQSSETGRFTKPR